MKPTLHVLTGCTAVGKTEWALRWAEARGAEIVSCDSLLFYRGMNLGTAKPTAAERARVPHHLIDLCEVSERMDVTLYVAKARAAVREIRASIDQNRRELGTAVEKLRVEVVQLTDWRSQIRRHQQQVLIGAGVAGFVLGGGIAALGALTFGRRRRRPGALPRVGCGETSRHGDRQSTYAPQRSRPGELVLRPGLVGADRAGAGPGTSARPARYLRAPGADGLAPPSSRSGAGDRFRPGAGRSRRRHGGGAHGRGHRLVRARRAPLARCLPRRRDGPHRHPGGRRGWAASQLRGARHRRAVRPLKRFAARRGPVRGGPGTRPKLPGLALI